MSRPTTCILFRTAFVRMIMIDRPLDSMCFTLSKEPSNFYFTALNFGYYLKRQLKLPNSVKALKSKVNLFIHGSVDLKLEACGDV